MSSRIARALSRILAAEVQLALSTLAWGSWSKIIDLDIFQWACMGNHKTWITHTCAVRKVVYKCVSTSPFLNGSFKLLGNDDRNDTSNWSNSRKAGDDRISGWSPYPWVARFLTGRNLVSPKFDLILYLWLKFLMKERSIVLLIYNVKESVMSGGWKSTASLTWHHCRTL